MHRSSELFSSQLMFEEEKSCSPNNIWPIRKYSWPSFNVFKTPWQIVCHKHNLITDKCEVSTDERSCEADLRVRAWSTWRNQYHWQRPGSLGITARATVASKRGKRYERRVHRRVHVPLFKQQQLNFQSQSIYNCISISFWLEEAT